MKKFWVVHNIPSPYRLHIFNAMWKECMERRVDFHVHFMSDMSRGYEERPLSWRNPKIDFPHTYWKDFGLGQRHINPGILFHLHKVQPEYLLSGSPFDTLTGMFAGRMTKGITCTWCEGNTKTPGKMDGMIGAIKRFALSGYKYVAIPGSDAAKYIELHQKRTHKQMPIPIFLPNLIDEERFTIKNWNATTDCVKRAIIPARLKPVKGLMEFISLLTPEMVNGWKILIIGDGELKDPLQHLIFERNLSNMVEIKQFVPYEAMPQYYAESDLMILPSIYDPNPLSVVEALHSGLPIALSSEAGNVEEAVKDGENGWVLPVLDKESYQKKIKEVFSTDINKLRQMGTISKNKYAKFWNTQKAINQFFNSLSV